MTSPSVLFYVQHLLGIGHLARASRIALAMQARGMKVTLVTGGLPVKGFPAPGLDHVTLPPVAVGDGAFAGLVDAAGRPVDEAYMAARQERLLATFADLAPDVVITEAFPFGRRQVRHELRALIAAIEAMRPRPLLVASIRDILQRRAKPGRDEETVETVRAHYDLVMVHGDPAFAALGDTFPLADRIADRVAYTGLVSPPPPPPPAERFDVVVSAGGGAVGAGLVAAALGAARMLPELGSWCVTTGPNLPQADFDRLSAAAPDWVRVERFRTDFASLLTEARLSISQAGYNTVADILQAGCRALLVPFAAGGETEQTDRAERLQAVGRVVLLPEDGLNGPAMAEAIGRALEQDPGGPGAGLISTDGAERSASLVAERLAARRA